jgi:hypothetical protein
MKHANQATPSNPFDVQAMWDMSGGPAAIGERAYRAWFDGATRMQTEATSFWNQRMAKDMAALNMLGQIQDPTQAIEAQVRYVREVMADYYEGSQRLLLMMRDVAAEAGAVVPDRARTEQ